VAIHGVGEVRAASDSAEGADELRSWAEANGGNLVMAKGDPSLFDPWGSPPPGLALQKRLVAEFDPARILNPGRLPEGV
jgi:FAD/FMN-containing dehydrogenase